QLLATRVGQQPVDAAGHVPKVEANRCGAARPLPERLTRESACAEYRLRDLLGAVHQRVRRRLEVGRDVRDGSAEPGFHVSEGSDSRAPAVPEARMATCSG